jgi:membrane-associated protein
MFELLSQGSDFFWFLIDFILHVDIHLNQLVTSFGMWTYVILFAIIFCETGLVVTPLLPGDSLLFATGAIAAIADSPLDIHLLAFLLIIAAILGDATNYAIGSRLGPKIFNSESSWLLNRKHLIHTQKFYEKFGGKTIIFARFMPIVRTFAPFVAGIGSMNYSRFAAFNVVGAVAWVTLFLYAGYGMGNLPAVKTNFHVIIFAIIFLSILPGIIEFFRHRKKQQNAVSNS